VVTPLGPGDSGLVVKARYCPARRLIAVDGTWPHADELAAHELGHALDAGLLRALDANAERSRHPDAPAFAIADGCGAPELFASSAPLWMRDYESDAVRDSVRRLQALAKSYAVEFVFGRSEYAGGVYGPESGPGVMAFVQYLKSPAEGFAELLGRYLRPGRLGGRVARPKKFEAEHLAEFRRSTLPFILRELREQESRPSAAYGVVKIACTIG